MYKRVFFLFAIVVMLYVGVAAAENVLVEDDFVDPSVSEKTWTLVDATGQIAEPNADELKRCVSFEDGYVKITRAIDGWPSLSIGKSVTDFEVVLQIRFPQRSVTNDAHTGIILRPVVDTTDPRLLLFAPKDKMVFIRPLRGTVTFRDFDEVPGKEHHLLSNIQFNASDWYELRLVNRDGLLTVYFREQELVSIRDMNHEYNIFFYSGLPEIQFGYIRIVE